MTTYTLSKHAKEKLVLYDLSCFDADLMIRTARLSNEIRGTGHKRAKYGWENNKTEYRRKDNYIFVMKKVKPDEYLIITVYKKWYV